MHSIQNERENDTVASLVEIEGLVHEYPDGTQALRGIDLTVNDGERIALLGPNGAGKSTLILHLNGILRPKNGSVRIAGEDVCDDTLADIRSRVGLVFQDPDDQMFMTTIYDDVAFGPLNMGLPHEEVDRRVHEALHAVSLENMTSKSGHHLSFGQRKRAALATVLSMSPEVLVLDEPTSNLDPRSRRHMMDLLDSLKATILLATHDMDLAWRLCSRAIIIDEGRVVVDGEAQAIFSDEVLLEKHGLELPPSLKHT